MKRDSWIRVLAVVLLALALTALAANAQDAPAPGKQAPVSSERGESASPAANMSESEPNNTWAAADFISEGDVISGVINPTGDVDIFELFFFEGRNLVFDIDAVSIGSNLDAYICVQGVVDGDVVHEYCNDDSDGYDSLLFVNLWNADGLHWYVRVRDLLDEGGAAYHYKLQVYQPLLVSATVAGTVQGIAFKPADVLSHYDFDDGTEKWMLFFDASDVGITKNLTAFLVDNPGYILFAVAANQSTGLGTVTPYDILSFVPDSLGPSTSGSLGIDTKGKNEGLTALSEKIDALALSDNYWAVSTTGAASVPLWSGALAARDEDLMELIWESGNDWGDTLYFDGSLVPGLAAEDLTAAGGHGRYLYAVIQGTGRIDGLSVNQKDIFVIDRDWNRVLGYYWRAGLHHFPYNIDAIDITQ